MQEWIGLWETAWGDFVFVAQDANDCCKARARTRRGTGAPVLKQCDKLVEHGDMFCEDHEAVRHYGVWDPASGLSGVWLEKNNEWVIADAKRRAMDDRQALPDESGFNVPRQHRRGGRPSGSPAPPQTLMQRTPVPEFVADVPGEVRCFAADPEALPPFPCLLCRDADFGSEAALRRHVADEHVSWRAYRKRLFHEAGRGRVPVMPQVWRLVMGHAAEELATGSKVWADDLVVGFDDMDTRAAVLQHMAQLVRKKGRLPKFLKILCQLLHKQKVLPTNSADHAVNVLCEANADVKTCFHGKRLTPHMDAAQQAVLHVARDGRCVGRPLSEANALFAVWDRYVAILEQKGLSSRDDLADWSRQVQDGDSVDGEFASEY